jgi:hypothetical protein
LNSRKAKAIRRAAREIALESGLPMSKQVFARREGKRAYAACAPAVMKQIKRMVKQAPGLPVAVIDQAGFDATF